MNFRSILLDTLTLQRAFFESQKTRSLEFRLEQLHKLKATMKSMEDELLEALKLDLNKSPFEAYASEVGFIYEEINHTIKNLPKWAKPQRVGTPFILKPSRSYIYLEPKGLVLNIAPWNYPIQLALSPLVAAIAAGNCVVVKPSELAVHSEKVLTKLIGQALDPVHCSVMCGGVEETQIILAQKFDHIFFTGSTAVGRIVMQKAAETLTPVTLELGGKSPCIVAKDANLSVTARRIAWAKFYNAGQTCVAPDYLLVERGIKDDLVKHLKVQIKTFFGEDPQKSDAYGRIINERNFLRLTAMLADGSVVAGGKHDKGDRYIEPTILDEIDFDARSMREEIFGPILPILEFKDAADVIAKVKRNPTPLACYIFSGNQRFSDDLVRQIPFGGGCVNNALVHLVNQDLPFGGVGTSGIGAYHGKTGFDTFSHRKAIVKSPFAFDLPMKYPPHSDGRLTLLKKFMR